MSEAVYDEHVAFYLDFVDAGLADPQGMLRTLVAAFDRLLQGRVDGADVLDVACGEGYLSRHLAAGGARSVVGVDISSELVAEAQRRSAGSHAEFRVDDAQALSTVGDASCDVVVSQLAVMDIPDHRAVFDSVRRVIRPGAPFVCSILHPCFEARPFRIPDEPPWLTGDDGVPRAVLVRRYATEGHWRSGGTGVRGRTGAYHRMLSTYLNDLIGAGFVLDRVEEPLAGDGLFEQVPRSMVVAATAR